MAELFGCPFKGWRGGGWGSNFTYVSYNTGCAAQMGGFYTQKICKHGSHFDPPPQKKDPETWVKFVENRVKNLWRKFWKIGRPT